MKLKIKSKGMIMSEPLLNVVIIAKTNTSLRFMNTLKSIMNQEYSPIKIVVVDVNDQDSDYSLGLQEDLAAYKDVEYIKMDSSWHPAKIRNHMLECMEGEYIAFLTANDTWDSKAAQTVIRELEENPDLNAVCMNGNLIDERRADINEEPLIEKEAYHYSKWILYNPARTSSQVVYRTEGIAEAGGFDEELDCLCDADMLLRLGKKNGVLIKSENMCECRMTESFRDYERKLFNELKKIRLKYLELYLQDRMRTQKFYEKMTVLSKINYMWLDFITYKLLCFINAPIKSMAKTMKKFGRFVRYIILWLRRDLSIVKDIIGIRYNVRYHKVKKKKYRMSEKEDTGVNVTFMSAREYNGQSPFDFAFNNKIRSVKIPEHVTTIKKGMFYGCESLVSVEIPASVTRIEAHAFQNCISLRNIKFAENSRLGKIGSFVFAGCISLEEIDLPPVAEIGSYIFAQCSSLKNLRFGQSHYFSPAIERIPRYAFAGCGKLPAVEFDGNSLLETIENKAFFGCRRLKKIVITGKLKKVGDYAFAYCSELESVAILNIDAVETIGKGAFMHCRKLPYFQFPSDIKRIRTRTFYGCSKLKSVKIPKKTLSINYQAFGRCPMLKNAVILSGDIMISAKAFDKHTKIQIKESVDTSQIYKAEN